jgi:hypothetical protein
MRRVSGLLLLLALAVGLVACSDDEGDDVASDDSSTETSAVVDDSTTKAGDSTATTTADEPDGDAYLSETYRDPSYWVCRPDLDASPCETDLDLTILNEDGTTEVVAHEVAEDPGFDCFYVYPTVNVSAEGIGDFDGEYGIEIGITRTQAGRFSSVCDVYAPLYRQTAFGAGPDVDTAPIREQAYQDVLDSFRHYLAQDNEGRPFVLMGHSQGSSHLNRLIQEEIDDDEALRSQMVSALLIGSGVTVPADGDDVGGDFQNVPACRADDQTGCVVTYASYRADDPPAETDSFGRPRDGAEGVSLCTNPAALSGGASVLQMIEPTGNEPLTQFGAQIDTPFVALPGFVSGECVTQDGATFFAITITAGSGPRTDDVNSDTSIPWGLHPIDYNLALGDLVDLVAAQAAAVDQPAASPDESG